jgi:glycosyltransferase involved in cell wall biosynthesis
MPWESMHMSNPLMPSLCSAIRRARADLVDAHHQLFLSTAMSVKAAMDEGKPVVTTVHGLMAVRDPLTNLSQRLYLLTVGSWALRNSTRVICLTKSDAEEVAKLGVHRRKVEMIPVAVDPNDFGPERDKQELILWAGRLVPEKRLDTLLAATAKLRKKREVRVVIIGDGPERRNLVRRTSALGISDAVQFKFKPERLEYCSAQD